MRRAGEGLDDRSGGVIGRFQATRDGFGFVVPEDGGAEIFIPPGETGGALHRDRVACEVSRPAGGTQRAEGWVREILERGFRTFTAVAGGPRARPYVVPDHPLLPPRLRLLGGHADVEAGQRLLCELREAAGRRGLAATLVRILGDADDPRLDTAIVEAEFGLPGPYPLDAEAEARARCAQLDSAPSAARRDFSSEEVLTIDPADARDFDDAVSLRPLPRGWLLRVHIADVAEAVVPGGALDAEARRRGNSTYLPGKMIPMLPEILATEAMSLAPERKKRVVTVSARLDDRGRVLRSRIEEGWIVSRHRLDYDTVQAVLDGERSLEPALDETLRRMDALAQRLRARRFARGGFDLDVPELEMTLDEGGWPEHIWRRTQGRSHQLIEEFMILANRAACAFAVRAGQPYMHRVHEPPEPLAVEAFALDVRTLAPEVRAADVADLAALRRWLAGLPREPRTWRIHALFLQALRRATYAVRDTGHFGLGLRGYGHFTSPIRRYPDLYNHRVVKWILHHRGRAVPDAWREEADAIALSCSASEERSERAERQLLRIKAVRWGERRLGESFRGTVAAVLSAGYVIELLEVPVEGFVPRRDAEAVVPYLEARRRIGPGRGGLQVGDAVIVQISRADRRERRLELILRAAGRRARETDPRKLDPLIDAWEQMTAPRRKGTQPRRRAGRRKGRAAHTRGTRRARRSGSPRAPRRRR